MGFKEEKHKSKKVEDSSVEWKTPLAPFPRKKNKAVLTNYKHDYKLSNHPVMSSAL